MAMMHPVESTSVGTGNANMLLQSAGIGAYAMLIQRRMPVIEEDRLKLAGYSATLK